MDSTASGSHLFDLETLSKKWKESSTKVKSHHPQIIDEDTENFKYRLEHLLNIFKGDAVSEFMTMKKAMLEEQERMVKHDTQSYLLQTEEKTNELKQAMLKIDKLENSNEKWENNSLALAEKFYGFKKKLRDLHLKKSYFDYFHSHSKLKIRNRKILNKSKNVMSELSLRQSISTWKLEIHRNMSIRISTKLKNDYTTEVEKITTRFNKELEILNERFLETKKQLDNANQTKTHMQDNLKKAFLRGVCALNYEAMSVLDGKPKINDPSNFLGNLENSIQMNFDDKENFMEMLNGSRIMENTDFLQNSGKKEISHEIIDPHFSANIMNSQSASNFHSKKKNYIIQAPVQYLY